MDTVEIMRALTIFGAFFIAACILIICSCCKDVDDL